MRILVLGNSGSGKSTYAARLGLPCLELDTIYWEPGQIAVARPADQVRADLAAFISTHESWVIEGCYGDLVEAALPSCSELVFLNPGLEACQANARRRPYEPHKYADPADQERLLPMLLGWIADYYTRDDVASYRYHRAVFDAFAGAKRELTERS